MNATLNEYVGQANQSLDTLSRKVLATLKPLPDLAERVGTRFMTVLEKLDPTSDEASISNAVEELLVIVNDIDSTSSRSKAALDREVLFPVTREIGRIAQKLQEFVTPEPQTRYVFDYPDMDELGI